MPNTKKNKQQPHSRAMSKQDELLAEQTRYFLNINKKISKTEALKQFIWNPETKAFMGRTGSSWSKIGLFYLIFYGMLAAMVAICMWVFFQTLNPRIPKWQLERSIIGTNPGLGFRPLPRNSTESALIWFQGSNKKNYQPWVDSLLEFLDGYYFPSKIAKGSGQIKTCSYSDFPNEDEVCEVDVREWGRCNKDEFFDYHRSSPCIFLKLNRIYGWKPDYYLYDHELPPEMPKQLKDHIRSINNTQDRKNIWVSCEGEMPSDKEYIGSITYYPNNFQGFPGYYFPYLNKEGYLSPLVAVRFERPVPGIVINVECRAWAKNIKYSRMDRTGSVHFELLID
ncbi:sodium/potassium-transporting ATPase subunit beta-2 isoform X1 [Sitophilus oryzae]|uniref:Sodium/potassium-transporting ATPase subunit beta-2 isoform X1 n=1 Tax=Sitophilus oryzae TaxID=7048 RepID=A0A6J2XCZ1_SITOR|nr:sodium/potassium-transporting ATPase subunit beta-2 isoform X1 [Sitophilus oryzae]